VTAAPAAAKPTTPIPVCAGATDLVVDVRQDVGNLAGEDRRHPEKFGT
jgi:hypothetical protein